MLRRDQVDLVDQDDIRECDLLRRFLTVVELLDEVPGVDERDDPVEPQSLLHLIIDEECLCDRARIGQARRLDEDRVEAVPPLHERVEDTDQIAADGATDAAIVHLEDFLFGADDELMIDAHLAKLILDDGDPLAMLFGEDPIQKRGLSRPEKSGEYRYRHAAGVGRKGGGLGIDWGIGGTHG